jgi:potassium efflux system protein
LLLLGLFLSFRLTAWSERRARDRGVDEDRARLVRRWSLGVLVCAWTLASLALAGIPLAAFAFAGGAIAIGLGFGTQNLFKNLISGILVLVERPFRLGDVIEVGALCGTVVDIDLRTSVVRDRDGAETLIPNSTLVEQNVRNLTFRSRSVRQSLSVHVEHNCDPRLAMDALRSAAERHGQLLDAPAPVVHLSDLTLYGQCFSLHYWLELTPGVDTQRIASDLRLMVFNALADAGLRLARAQAEASLPAASTRGHGPDDAE